MMFVVKNDDYDYIICPKCNNEIVISGVRWKKLKK